MAPDKIAKKFRQADTSVIGRIEKNSFILDMKAVNDEDIKIIGETAEKLFGI